MPFLFVFGVGYVLHGIIRTLADEKFTRGIWSTGFGTVFTVLGLLCLAGYNNTAYYPSTADLQSSLTLSNSCSSEFTLTAMSIVSFLIPLVLLGMVFTWRPLIMVGIVLYALVALFQLLTLPVEFNASRRALQTIESNQFLTEQEYRGAKKVLTAAALTYVAALASALATLLRLLLLAGRSDDR